MLRSFVFLFLLLRLKLSLSTDTSFIYRGLYCPDTANLSPNTIMYKHFLCRGDLSVNICKKCESAATKMIAQKCDLEKAPIIVYDECILRYSNESTTSIVEEEPVIELSSWENITESTDQFMQTVSRTMNDIANSAANDESKFATKEANTTSRKTVYCLAQCTLDLSADGCKKCLLTAIDKLHSCCSGKTGGRVVLPSCNVRYEEELFYNLKSEAHSGGKKALWIKIGISVSAFLVAAILMGSFIFYRWRNKRVDEGHKKIQKSNLLDLEGQSFADYNSNESLSREQHVSSQDFPFIHFDLIRAATQQFSNENKLGEGGFGPVYKGRLVNGKEIAVKRLSRTSGQGLQEFKNEVTLIAKLQHKNLVTLLGYCVEGNELLLIYEYMPNKSLDTFLFDSTKAAELDWKRRVSIINGIARGLMYLHEDSRLRIIHRDLKAGNVLLDHEMNSKISDFGMARIFCGNQGEANTNRVVGTYGYMAPEYAMEGLFSVKSDVFSFGVLLLEIICGKKNSGFYLSEYGQSLLNYAWKLWSEGKGLELMDPLLVKSCVAAEVLKCIHIGLLCVQEDPADRPTMSNVILMLGSETISLPQPSKPAFSVGRSSQSTHSLNEATFSSLSPRGF